MLAKSQPATAVAACLATVAARGMHAVGIVGGGLAGSFCAGALAQQGHKCTIWDMGFQVDPERNSLLRSRSTAASEAYASRLRVAAPQPGHAMNLCMTTGASS